MKYEKNRKILGIDEYLFMKTLKILILPIVVIILLAIIVISDRLAKKNQNKVEESIAIAETIVSEQEELKNRLNDFDTYGFQENAVEEVNELIKLYHKAKVSGDMDTMSKLFDIPEQEKEVVAKRLRKEKRLFESFGNTVCYTTSGLEEDSYIVYVKSDIKFKGVETLVPALNVVYIIKNEEGGYVFKTELVQQEKNLLEKIAGSEKAKQLDSDMRVQLANAVINDIKLGTIYMDMLEGAGRAKSSENSGEEIEEATVSILETVAEAAGEESTVDTIVSETASNE